MTLIESIELAQEKFKESTYLATVFIERLSWSKIKNIVVAISEEGICFIPKFDNTKCFISLEDLKADDWKLTNKRILADKNLENNNRELRND